MIPRLLLIVLVAGGFGAAVPAAGVPLPEIPRGVTVGGVPVGGLTYEPARARLEARFGEPLTFFHGVKTWTASPGELGANASIQAGVVRALHAKPRASLKLRVVVRTRAVKRYVASLDKRFRQPATNAQLVGLSGLRPSFTEAKAGRRVDGRALTRQIERALHSTWRGAQIALPLVPVEPEVTSADYGPIVVIQRRSKQLDLYNGSSLVRTYGVATGQKKYPTPLGSFEIVNMQRDPWWNPPDSEWAKDAKPIPPGPGNPLGTRWMGISSPGVGIHGTPDAASIGYSASHGCIRMRIPDAEAVFTTVEVGTPVYIVGA